jgi:hypothetical protein
MIKYKSTCAIFAQVQKKYGKTMAKQWQNSGKTVALTLWV